METSLSINPERERYLDILRTVKQRVKLILILWDSEPHHESPVRVGVYGGQVLKS